jgi:hypothetical protein
MSEFKLKNTIGEGKKMFWKYQTRRLAINTEFILAFNFSLKINWLNQLITKLACLMQHQRKYEAKIVMKVRVLKLKCINSTMSRSPSFCGSFMIPVTTLFIVMFAERQVQILPAKPNLLSERQNLNVKVLFIK